MRRALAAAVLLTVAAATVGARAAVMSLLYRCDWTGTVSVYDTIHDGSTFTIVGGAGTCQGHGTTYRITSLTGSGERDTISAGEFSMDTTLTLRPAVGGTLRLSQGWEDPELDGSASTIDGDVSEGEGFAEIDWGYAPLSPYDTAAHFHWTFVYLPQLTVVSGIGVPQRFTCSWKGTIVISDDFEGDVHISFGAGSGRCLHASVAWPIVSLAGSGEFVYPSVAEPLASIRFTVQDPVSGRRRMFSQLFDLSVPTQPRAFLGDLGGNYRYIVRANDLLPVGEGSVTNYARYSGGNSPVDPSQRTSTFDWLFVTLY